MKLRIADVYNYPSLRKAIVHSVDQMLYIITIVIDGQEKLLHNDDGSPFRTTKLSEVHLVLELVNAEETVLRQQSAYDEMIGQPAREGDNTLEVPFAVQR
ncbi:MAG: DUF6482 family protein [Pseudomonadales bacterium]